MKDDIIQARHRFNQSLFEKVSQALQIEMQRTTTRIEYEQDILRTYTGNQQVIQDRAARIVEQLTIIQQIKETEKFETLIPLFSRYLYLKRLLE